MVPWAQHEELLKPRQLLWQDQGDLTSSSGSISGRIKERQLKLSQIIQNTVVISLEKSIKHKNVSFLSLYNFE